MTVGHDYRMGEYVSAGCLLFRWPDGMLRTHPPKVTGMIVPIGRAGVSLDRDTWVRLMPNGQALPLIYNPCGDIHLGRCCVNGTRPDGSIGLTCTHCGGAITEEQREEINDSFAQVARLAKLVGAK